MSDQEGTTWLIKIIHQTFVRQFSVGTFFFSYDYAEGNIRRPMLARSQITKLVNVPAQSPSAR